MKSSIIIVLIILSGCMYKQGYGSENTTVLHNYPIKIIRAYAGKHGYVDFAVEYKGKKYVVRARHGVYEFSEGSTVNVNLNVYEFRDEKDKVNVYDDVVTYEFEII